MEDCLSGEIPSHEGLKVATESVLFVLGQFYLFVHSKSLSFKMPSTQWFTLELLQFLIQLHKNVTFFIIISLSFVFLTFTALAYTIIQNNLLFFMYLILYNRAIDS